MFGNKDLILTQTTCTLIENLRLSVEVLLGAQARYKHMHLDHQRDVGHGSFRGGHGCFIVKDTEIEVEFSSVIGRPSTIEFMISGVEYIAHIKGLEAQVVRSNYTPGAKWRVGTSFSTVREELVYK